ncbi:PREDICTED: chromatin assembly factor 1 subunit A-B, partial [Rhagoletis zephyria]|uniref:chromatin assembly factor 1 subunit A-B n=1 Tax=Rhagoletis zephyria TaxID=28612 RepID=UPI0008119FFD
GAAKKSSGKKLVQARLPFKIISSATTPSAGCSAASKETETVAKDARKRRLSFDYEEKSESAQDESDALRGRSASKENLTSAKKKKIDDDNDVVLLDDDDILEDEDENKAKEKGDDQELIIKKQDKNLAVASPNTIKSKPLKKKNASNSPHTPKPKEIKGKETGTPKSINVKKSNTPGSAKNKSSGSKASGSAPKVQIKLPLGSGKANKRRKSKMPVECVDAELVISSDENESNSVKRPKVEGNSKELELVEKAEGVIDLDSNKVCTTTVEEVSNSGSEVNSNVLLLEIGGIETDVLDSELDSRCSSTTIASKGGTTDHVVQSQDGDNVANKPEESNSSKPASVQSSKDKVQSHDSNSSTIKSDMDVISGSATKIEHTTTKGKQSVEKITSSTEDIQAKVTDKESADISVVIASSSDSENSSTVNEESKSYAEESAHKVRGTPKITKEDSNTALKKNLTPKQIKLMEQRRKAREEKERRLQEERSQKQREKEAKELAKKREREEREEQRRKEREERDDQKRKEREERDEQKRKEREEKERKRLAEQEAKNEEKRKRNEAKEEELRKKEEERKRKEGADLKAKKEAEAFQKFFKTKCISNGDGDAGQQQAYQDDGCDPETLAFRPFEVKGDMKLAPVRRKQLSPERKQQLDSCVDACMDSLTKSQDLYLAELKNGKVNPGRWRRISVDTKASDDDIQIIDDDLDRAGLAIVEETHAPIEHFRAKFYKFHENRRPPYYGTWRKRTSVIKPRRPFVQDTKHFDYEVDSDLEWEEEEPGESLDGSDDEKEKESEDEDYEVDNEWFVPHGHLSEEELQNEDEVLDANTREAQKAKLRVLQQEFAQEMKKKTEKIKPRLIGCIWIDENGNQPALCPKIIWDTLNIRAMLCERPPLLEDPEVPEKSELGSPTSNGNEKTVEKVKPIKLTDRMLKDLVCLVHGNQHSKNFLIKEFIAFLEANEESIKNGEVRGPIKSIVREKIDDFAEWTITDSVKVLQNNKKKNKKRLCWVVSADVLKKMDLENLGLRNTWKYTLQPRVGTDESTRAEIEVEKEATAKETTEVVGNEEKEGEIEVESKTKKGKNKSVGHPKKEKKTTIDLKTTSDESKPIAEITTTTTPSPAEATTKVKKRVPLLMSVARGQQISQPTKNALISEFLQKSSAEKEASSSKNASAASNPVSKGVVEVIELD